MNSDPNAVPAAAGPADRLLDLVGAALDLPPGERAGFLTEACQEDVALLAEARSLVAHVQGTGAFLERPAYALAGGEELGGVEAGSLQAGEMLDECRVISLLGEGGMGEVYLAEDTKLERRVAVKLLKRRLDDASLARRFRHERKVLAALTHPNIARLYGGGTTSDGRSYLVIEYIDGERLDRFCERRGLEVIERLTLFRKVCAAVAYAHQNLVVHRDLKPANIRVTPEGEPKLLDFGIAKLLDSEGSPTGQVDPTVTMHAAMTPEYASPEQLRGEAITTASDVYSLGVVLYELLTGQRPFAHLKSRRPDDLARAICEQDPPAPSTVAGRSAPTGRTTDAPGRLRHALLGDLDNIVAKALRKEPGRRYPSVLAFSEDLRRHAEGLPVTARKDTLRYRMGKFVRRHQAGVAAGVLVFLALVAGMIVAIWQARSALRDRDRAHLAQKQAERLNAFLEDLLSSVDPSRRGKDVKVADVLDDASRKLDRELAVEPEVLAQAHDTLRRSYLHLGLFEPAEEHARAAFALEQSLHGPDDPATAQAEAALANVFTSRAHPYEAEPLLRHALAVFRRQPMADEAALAHTLEVLGYDLCQQRRTREAEPLINEALIHARVAWGERSPSYANILNELGTLKVSDRDYVSADPIYRRLVALQDELAPGGTASITPLTNLCICLFNEEKWSELRQMLGRLEPDTLRLYGEKSLYHATAIYGQGLVDAADGNYLAAIPSIRAALPIISATLPQDNSNVVQCRAELGVCLTRAGRAAEGEPLLRTALADGTKVDRADFAHSFGNLEVALGECLLAQKRYAEAESLLLAGHDDLARRLSPQNRLTLQAVRRLHELYLAWDKPSEAARFDDNVAAGMVRTP